METQRQRIHRQRRRLTRHEHAHQPEQLPDRRQIFPNPRNLRRRIRGHILIQRIPSEKRHRQHSDRSHRRPLRRRPIPIRQRRLRLQRLRRPEMGARHRDQRQRLPRQRPHRTRRIRRKRARHQLLRRRLHGRAEPARHPTRSVCHSQSDDRQSGQRTG